MRIVQGKHLVRHFLEIFDFIVFNVVHVAFGEPKNKESPLALAEQDHAAVAAGFPLAWPRNPLLDESAAKVSVYQPEPRIVNGFA